VRALRDMTCLYMHGLTTQRRNCALDAGHFSGGPRKDNPPKTEYACTGAGGVEGREKGGDADGVHGEVEVAQLGGGEEAREQFGEGRRARVGGAEVEHAQAVGAALETLRDGWHATRDAQASKKKT